MPARRIYDDPTSVVGLRLPELSRRCLEYLAIQAGSPTLSEYLRDVLEAHLEDLGFDVRPGGLARCRPDPDEARAHQAAIQADVVANRPQGVLIQPTKDGPVWPRR